VAVTLDCALVNWQVLSQPRPVTIQHFNESRQRSRSVKSEDWPQFQFAIQAWPDDDAFGCGYWKRDNASDLFAGFVYLKKLPNKRPYLARMVKERW